MSVWQNPSNQSCKNMLPITKSGPNAGLSISLKFAPNKIDPKSGDNNKDNIPIALFE